MQVYFNDQLKDAKAAVDACLGRWQALLGSLAEEERGRVVRSMGLKISQLQVRRTSCGSCETVPVTLALVVGSWSGAWLRWDRYAHVSA